MTISGNIVKEIVRSKDELFTIIMRNEKDEYGEKYSSKYSTEFKNFIESVEYNIDKIKEINMELTVEVFKTIIVLNWDCGFYTEVMPELDSYLEQLIEFSKKEIDSEKLKITELEQSFLKNICIEKIKNEKKLLTELYLDNGSNKIFEAWKSIDEKQFEKYTINVKKNYYYLVEMFLRMYGIEFCDWETNLNIEEESILKSNLINLGEVSERDNQIFKRVIEEKKKRYSDILMNFALDNGDDITFKLKKLKEEDLKEFKETIEEIKEKYVFIINIIYKTFNEQPKKWDEEEKTRIRLCRFYNIERDRFLF